MDAYRIANDYRDGWIKHCHAMLTLRNSGVDPTVRDWTYCNDWHAAAKTALHHARKTNAPQWVVQEWMAAVAETKLYVELVEGGE